MVQTMSQEAEAVIAQVKASISTPAFPWKVDSEMIPFLMVPDTLAPTRTAPRNSQIPARTQACRKVSDRDETDVAKELRVDQR